MSEIFSKVYDYIYKKYFVSIPFLVALRVKNKKSPLFRNIFVIISINNSSMVSKGMKNAIKILIQNREITIKKKLILLIEFYTSGGTISIILYASVKSRMTSVLYL